MQELIVCQRGTGQYLTIAEAMAVAQSKSRIYVRPGIYEGVSIGIPVELIADGTQESVVIESKQFNCLQLMTDNILVRGFTLRGKSREKNLFTVHIPLGNSVLEGCDITNIDSTCCVGISSTDANPIIRQCRIHDSSYSGIYIDNSAQVTIENCYIFNHSNAGITILEASSPYVRKCYIYNNQGNGVFLSGESRGIIQECDIFANQSAGVAIVQNSDPLLWRCTVHDGINVGIFISESGKGSIENCDIFNNALAGIWVDKGSQPKFWDCNIYHNQENGFYFSGNSKGLIDNCNIFNNIYPGICILYGSSPIFRCCRTHHNQRNGIWVNENGHGLIEECDIYDNQAAGIGIQLGSDPIVRYCRVYDNAGEAVQVANKGAGSIENCNLTGNRDGAWFIETGCQVQRKQNIDDSDERIEHQPNPTQPIDYERIAKSVERQSEKVPEREKLIKALQSRVLGQNAAITELVKQVLGKLATEQLAIDTSSKPRVIMLAGPTGTGKTELSKALAKTLEVQLHRFDMGEFADEYKSNNIFGSALGFSGSESGGMLPNALREPERYKVFLFDEIEKANQKLWPQLLAFFDEGRVKDTKGQVIAPKDTICLLTTNLRAEEIAKTPDLAKDLIKESGYLPTEFIGRIDKVIVMLRLSPVDLAQLTALCAHRLAGEYGMTLQLDEAALEHLMLASYHEAQKYGGRGIIEKLRDLLTDQLLDWHSLACRQVRLVVENQGITIQKVDRQQF